MSVAREQKQRPIPLEVKREVAGSAENRTGSGLRIRWSDGREDFYESILLRRGCPCATCREERGDVSHAKPLASPEPPKRSLLRVVHADAEEQIDLARVWPIGNYALGIRWGDGHDSGIYSFDYLLGLREQINTAAEGPGETL